MVVVLALLAALLFALAGAAEQRAATRVLRPPASARCVTACCAAACREPGPAARLRYRARRGLRQAVSLLRSPLWIAGWAADALGFGTQAGAVHFGSLSVVQPLLVTTLLFSLPLAALGGRRRPRAADWAAAAAACAGLALVLSGRRPAATATVHPARLMLLALLLVSVAATLVVAARARSGRGHAVPLSVAAGIMFALGAAFTKLVTDSLATRGVGGTIGYWPVYALIVVSFTGLALQQVAFSAGSLPATMAAMTITDPLVSYGLGVAGFGEQAPHGPGPLGVSLAGLALLGTGIAFLARSPLLHPPAAAVEPSRPVTVPPPAVPACSGGPGAPAGSGSPGAPAGGRAALPSPGALTPAVTPGTGAQAGGRAAVPGRAALPLVAVSRPDHTGTSRPVPVGNGAAPSRHAPPRRPPRPATSARHRHPAPGQPCQAPPCQARPCQAPPCKQA